VFLIGFKDGNNRNSFKREYKLSSADEWHISAADFSIPNLLLYLAFFKTYRPKNYD
jgi:hypothetical protein